MKKLLLVTIAIAALAPAAFSQVTWNQPAFTNQAASGPSAIFRNINQSSHWLTWCAGSAVTGGTIVMRSSASGTFTDAIPISNVGVLAANQCGSIQAGGYYPNVDAYIQGFTGGAPGVTATYSASTGVTPTPANAGYATTDQPVTFVPIINPNTNSNLKSTAYQLSTFGAVLYGATAYNPNGSVVFLAYGASSTPFVGGGSDVFMIPVPAGGTVTIPVPPQGVYFGAALYEACSTSPTSAVDPASACVVSALYKQVSTGIVPN
jgi:hypothetical protein